MADLRELYQDVILEHSKAPRNFRALGTANHKAEGYNPLCGESEMCHPGLAYVTRSLARATGTGVHRIAKSSVTTNEEFPHAHQRTNHSESLLRSNRDPQRHSSHSFGWRCRSYHAESRRQL